MAGILSRSTPSPVTGVVATAWNAGIWGAGTGGSDARERALRPARMELSERAWQLGLLAEPAPGAAPRRSPRAAFPSPGPRPRPATLTRRLRRSATEGNGGRKAATPLDHAQPPHALALAPSVPGKLSNIPCQASHDVLAIVVGTFGNVAAETQMRMSGTPLARTRRHHLRPLGAPARDPTSSFAAALISPRT